MQLILGDVRSNGSAYLYETIMRMAESDRTKNFMIIVPEQYTLEVQKEMVSISRNKCILNVDVLSFERLAFKLCSELGINDHGLISEEGKTYITGNIARSLKGELKVFGSRIDRPGYIKEIKSTLSELSCYNIRTSDIKKATESDGLSRATTDKLMDIMLFKNRYDDFLKSSGISGEELLIRLSRSLKNSRIIRDNVFAFDGFTGFTPNQVVFLRSLLEYASGTFFNLIFPGSLNYKKKLGSTHEFCIIQETIGELNRIAGEAGIEFKAPIILGGNCSAGESEHVSRSSITDEASMTDMDEHHSDETESHASKGQLSNSQAFKEQLSGPRTFKGQFPGPQDEVEFIKHKIIGLIADEGYRYSQIGIVCTDIGEYKKHFVEIFEENNIPYFMDDRQTLLEHSFGRFIRYLMEMIETDLSFESVFKYLKSGYSTVGYDDVCFFENYVLATGIRGYTAYERPFARTMRSVGKNEMGKVLERVNNIRELFLNEISGFVLSLRQLSGHKGKVSQYCDALRTFLDSNNMETRLSEMGRAMLESSTCQFDPNGNADIARGYEEVFSFVMEVLDEMTEFLGNENVDLDEFTDYLKIGFEEKKLKMTPPGQDQIIIGDLRRSRFGHIKTMFICGASDDLMPNLSKTGIISDTEKGALKNAGITLSPMARERIGREKFYYYLHLQEPSQFLYVTSSLANANGDDRRESSFVRDMLRYTSFEPIREQNEFHTIREAVDHIASGIDELSQGESDENTRSLIAHLMNDKEAQKAIELLSKGLDHRRTGDNISRDVSQKLFGSIIETSVSRINEYALCPYRYFIDYGLRIDEREEFSYTVRDNGSLIHSILEAVSNRVRSENLEFASLTPELISRYVDEAIYDNRAGNSNMVLYSSKRNEYTLVHLGDVIKTVLMFTVDQLKAGSFRPVEFERAFDGNTDPRFSFKDKEGIVTRLRGKIDRIDAADGDIFNVVDYKSSEREFSLSDVYDGVDLQLPIYAYGVKKLADTGDGKEPRIAGAGYYSAASIRVNADDIKKDPKKMVCDKLRPHGLYDSDSELIGKYGDDKAVKSFYRFTPNNLVEKADLDAIIDYAIFKLKKTSADITNGKFDIRPYADSQKTSCKYCLYHDICRFDNKCEGFSYRKKTNFKDVDTLMALIKEALKEGK